MIVLITDRPEESRSVQRSLALVGPCIMVPPHKVTVTSSSVRMIVSNVFLGTELEVEIIRASIACYSSTAAPLLCLLSNETHQARLQAYALGADSVLAADAPRSSLLAIVLDLLRPAAVTVDQPLEDFTRRCAVMAGGSVADMFDEASSGKGVCASTLAAGVGQVLDGVERGGIRAWLDIVWNYDDVTYRHSLLVAGLAASFALNLGVRQSDRVRLTTAALLHDIGKASIPLEILNKPGPLTTEELVIMRTHAEVGYNLLVEQGGFTSEQLSVVRSHHEYLDGSGYPDGLQGVAIPDLVRLVTICDIYAALLEKRSYKDAMQVNKAFAIMAEMGGKLDRALLAGFRLVIRSLSGSASLMAG